MYIIDGLALKCPFTACACQYSVISSFSACISRKQSCTHWHIINLEVVYQDTINSETAVGENVQATLSIGASLPNYDQPDTITLAQAQYAFIYMKV